MNQINASVSFLLLAWIVPMVGIADDHASEHIQSTTIEAVTVDGNVAISIETGDVRIVARSLTIEGPSGALKLTASPKGIEMKNGNINDASVSMSAGGKLELRTSLKITKLDLIRLEIGSHGR